MCVYRDVYMCVYMYVYVIVYSLHETATKQSVADEVITPKLQKPVVNHRFIDRFTQD